MKVKKMKTYDITRSITKDTKEYPGNKKYFFKSLMDINEGAPLNVNSFKMSMHLGTHIDGTKHFKSDGMCVGKIPIEKVMGKCQVIELEQKFNYLYLPKDIKVDIKFNKVLFKTNTFFDLENWNQDFSGISPELIKYLGQKKVVLIGIDTPGLDLIDSQDFLSHKEAAKYDIVSLENLDLKKINAGNYNLIALPLKFEEAEASLVRAILTIE